MIRVARVIVRRHGDRVLSRCWVVGVVQPRLVHCGLVYISTPAALINQHLDDQAVHCSDAMHV